MPSNVGRRLNDPPAQSAGATGGRRLLRVGLVSIVLGVSACSNLTHPASHRLSPSSQLTLAQARQAFRTFLPGFAQLPLNFSPTAARRLTMGAELQAQLFLKGQSGPPITGLTNEAFYVPRMTGYPRWFLAAGQQGGASAAGHLFVMVQSARSAPWRAAMALYDIGSAAGMLHQLAATVTTDARGYAIMVPLADPSLDVTPSSMPGTYARYLNGTASRAVARLFQAGPTTTGFIAFDRQVSRNAGRYGWLDTDHHSTAPAPVYALRLNTGGAIVIFAIDDAVRWRARTSAALLPSRSHPAAANYVPPAFVSSRLGISSVKAGTVITATAIDRVLAFVQPKGVGFIYPLINNGAATGVQATSPR